MLKFRFASGFLLIIVDKIQDMIKNLFFLLLFPLTVFSQQKQITINGTTKSKTEDIYFAHVTFQDVSGNKFTTISDENAKYNVSLNEGTYEVKGTYIGYKDFVTTITVTTVTILDIIFEPTDTELNEVLVRGTAQKVTDISVMKSIRNNIVVSDGLSIEFIKKTPDRNLGDALKRVSGVTIQNDKFVLVRGLADRYNSALLNQTPLPSTEPDRRAFSFDIIPTSLIDNIMVSKSFSANQPGDWSGGLVQVSTKEVSDNFLDVSFGTGIGSVSTFRGFKLVESIPFPSTFPSTYKYRISGNGDKRLFTKQIGNPTENGFQSIPNLNGGVSFGYVKNKFNSLFSSTIRNTNTLNIIERKDYQSSTELAYDYNDRLYTQRFSTNGLLNLTYLGKNKYSWKTLANFQKESSYLTREGQNFDNVQDVLSNASNHINNVVINSQVDGNIETFDFNFGYNYIFRFHH